MSLISLHQTLVAGGGDAMNPKSFEEDSNLEHKSQKPIQFNFKCAERGKNYEHERTRDAHIKTSSTEQEAGSD